MVYLVESYNDLKVLPLGIPFIRGTMRDYDRYVMMMEWEVLWKGCRATGLPFKWEKILNDNGYVEVFKSGRTDGGSGMAAPTGEAPGELAGDFDIDLDDYTEINSESSDAYAKYINDISYKVEIDVLKDLKLLPVWLDNIETAVKENITTSIVYNPALYTKKLDLPLGGVEYSPAIKNVIIMDISGSIPNGVSKTILALSKTLAEQFYADLLITGSKSTLYEYDRLDLLNIDTIYSKNGQDNDQVYFRKLVEEPRKYKTAIVFGDENYPGHRWYNRFNKDVKSITEEDGKALCKWEINDIISFHTKFHDKLAGYSRWFNTSKITHIDNWLTDLN